MPVLAAGGIASARGLAAVLAAGAAGAWLGTVFATCAEALTSAAVRDALLAAGGAATVTTRVFDVAQGFRWPATIPERVLRNDFVDRWDGHDAELDAGARDALAAAVAADDLRLAPVNAGQGVGMVTDTRSAADATTSTRRSSALVDRLRGLCCDVRSGDHCRRFGPATRRRP